MKGHQRPLHIVLVCEAAGGGVGKYLLLRRRPPRRAHGVPARAHHFAIERVIDRLATL
jgi:hypothetical protein